MTLTSFHRMAARTALTVVNRAAGLLMNVLIWNRDADLPRLAQGGTMILASLWLNRQGRRGLVTAAAG